MDKMIAFCGLDCSKCDAYIATINDDDALRKKTASLWAKLNNAPILPEHINCNGCRADGRKTVYCQSICRVRQCALNKGVGTCGSCPEVDTCPVVGTIHSYDPEARKNLEKAG